MLNIEDLQENAIRAEDRPGLIQEINKITQSVAKQVIPDYIKAEMKEVQETLIKKSDQYLKNEVIGRVADIVDEALKDKIREELFRIGGNLNKEINDLKTKLMQYRSFAIMDDQVKRLVEFSNVSNKNTQDIREIKLRLKSIESFEDDKSIPPVILDYDLKRLYIDSEISLVDVQNRFNVSLMQANNYVNGKVKDMTIRKQVYLFLRGAKDAKLGRGE